jgi:hypothetical protein
LIRSLPNGLQRYALFGAWNQRRVDAFTWIVRDPRLQRYVADNTIDNLTADGMKRANNDLRDWLDEGGGRRRKGEYGADGWKNGPETVARVRELYKPSQVMRATMESDRRMFLSAMAQVNDGMLLGADKNTYVEPAIWTIEWAQHFYKYPITRSN